MNPAGDDSRRQLKTGTSPVWFKFVIAAIALAVLIVVVIEPSCLCSVPFFGLFLAGLLAAMQFRGLDRICGICGSLIIGLISIIALLNFWNLSAAAGPIRAMGGSVYTSGDGMNDIFGPSAVGTVEFRRREFTDSDLEKIVPSLR